MIFNFDCPHCGTKWIVSESFSGIGFIQACVNHHIYRCREKTPNQRLRWIDKAENAPDRAKHSYMVFDRKHPGVEQ